MLNRLLNRPGVRSLALAVTVALLVALLWRNDDSRNQDATDQGGQNEPDGFVEDGRYLSFDQEGRRIASIESPRIEQFEPEGLATMTSPSATLYDRQSGLPWHLTANSGTFHQPEDRLVLSGDVKVIRPLEGEREATLITDKLTLDNSNRTVFTDKPVLITDEHGQTAAVGMKAWIDDRILELNSQVEGHYAPLKATHD